MTGKVAIVVGGAGGIGRVQALGLAEAGSDVVVASRNLEHLEMVAKEIQTRGRKSLAVPVEVTEEKSVVAMVDSVLKQFSHIDILVNAHGLAIRKAADTFPIDEWQQVMDINTRGTFICCQAVGRVMIKQRSGKIINVSSVRGRYGLPADYTAYCASKGAVDTLTRTLACEWAKYNVLVNAVAPTIVETELTRPALANRMPESMTLLETRDAEIIIDDILTTWTSSEAEEFASVIPLQQETEKAQRRNFRQNEMLFRSLRDHTREKVDWQVLEKWKGGWNRSRAAMNALRCKAEETVRNILDNQKPNVRDKIEASEMEQSILANMVAGIVEVVWRGMNDNTLEKVADLVRTKPMTEGRGLIVFGESGSVTRIELADSGLAKDVAEICRWAAKNLSIEEREEQIRLYKDGIEAMKEAIKKLEDALNPLMLRPMILRTECDLCPA